MSLWQEEARSLLSLRSRKGTKIKIEVNTTMRGSINPPAMKQVVPATRKEFGKFAAMQVVSDAEIFGGKICAALDRQHPDWSLSKIKRLQDLPAIKWKLQNILIYTDVSAVLI